MSDNRNDFMDAMGVLGALTVGALVGAGVALLLAPKSGAELRQELKTGAERIEAELSEVQHKATDSVKVQVDKLHAKATELTKKAEELAARVTQHDEEPTTEA
jgi:gas vesicle protein